MPDIFISYSRRDGDFAEVLRSRLRAAGFSSWIDLEGLQAGEEWGPEIDQAIRNSVAMILVLTPTSRASGYVAYEWAFALGAGVRVIPILLAPTELPPRLSALQHLDFGDPASRPWESLLRAVQTAAEARPVHSIQIPRTAPAVVRDAVAALDDADPAITEKAVLRLAEMDLPEAGEALVQALRHPVPDVRIAAAWQLARRRDPRAVPGLIEGNRRRGWHHEFARKVAEIGLEALPGLQTALADPQAFMRRDAVWALQEIGDPAVVPELVRRLADGDEEVRRESIRALGHFREASPVQALIEVVRGGDEEDWLAAVEALQRVGTPEALSAVIGQVSRLIRTLRGQGRDPRVRRYPRGDRIVSILNALGTEEAKAEVARWNAEREDQQGV